MRILVAIDLSPASGALVEFATRLAARMGGELTVLHAYTVGDTAVALQDAGLSIDQFVERLHGEAAHLLREAGAEAGRFRIAIVQGNPVEAILERATQHGADVIVVGTHGRTGLTRLLMGSVAEGVLRRAPCPVVVVPYEILVPAARQAAA